MSRDTEIPRQPTYNLIGGPCDGHGVQLDYNAESPVEGTPYLPFFFGKQQDYRFSVKHNTFVHISLYGKE